MNRIKSIKRKHIDYSTVPYNIITEFEKVNEKKCISADKENEKTYKSLIYKARMVAKNIENTGLSMSLEVPPPTTPNNRDKWILWKKRNVSKHVILQSEAVIFLYEHGYKINEHYEAYQAIDLANEIRKQNGESELQSSSLENGNKFNNLYKTEDKNIYRNRSMYGSKAFDAIINNIKDESFERNPNFNDIRQFTQSNQSFSQIKSENYKIENNKIENNKIENNIIENKCIMNVQPSAPPPFCNDFGLKSINNNTEHLQDMLYPSY